MFERYSEKARRVIFVARYEAGNHGSKQIEPEHILLGFLRERAKSIEQYFDSPYPLEEIRKEIVASFTIGPRVSTSVELPLAEKSERVLKVAAEEADRLSHKMIATEHILFAILQEDCPGSRVLRAHGMKHVVPHEEQLETNVFEVEAPPEPIWQEQGIPEGYGFTQLLFNPPTRTIVIEVCHGSAKKFLPNRLFWKRKDTERYKPLGEPEENRSQQSAVTSLSEPTLFFNSMRFSQHEGPRASAEWESLYSVDLQTMTVARYASKETLQLPAPYNDCWVTGLLSISEDGELLYLTIGMCQKSGASRSNIAYYLAELDVRTKNLRTISLLRAAFF